MTGRTYRDDQIDEAHAAVERAREQLADAERLLAMATKPSVTIDQPGLNTVMMFRYRTKDGGRMMRAVCVRVSVEKWQVIKHPESGIGLTNSSPSTWDQLVKWMTEVHEDKRMESYPYTMLTNTRVGRFE